MMNRESMKLVSKQRNFDIFSKENAKRKMQNAKVILKFAF